MLSACFDPRSLDLDFSHKTLAAGSEKPGDFWWESQILKKSRLSSMRSVCILPIFPKNAGEEHPDNGKTALVLCRLSQKLEPVAG